MKVLIALTSVAFLGTAFCDKPQTSSYAVLPYENEIHHHQAPHGEQFSTYSQLPYEQGSYDYDGGSGKKGFSFGGMVKAPMKALKGAGNYMRGMFDDVTSKFLELKGSFLKARGSFLTAHGQNVLTNAYKKKAQGNLLYPVEYYNPGPQPYHAPSYPQPLGSAYAAINPHDQYESHGHNNIISEHKAHPEPAYSGQGSASVHGTHGGNPAVHDIGHSAPSVVQGGSSYATVPHRRREFVEQRSSRRKGGYSGRTQRAYSFGPMDDPNPIPVPVVIPVYPSRLVFPSIPGINQHGGY